MIHPGACSGSKLTDASVELVNVPEIVLLASAAAVALLCNLAFAAFGLLLLLLPVLGSTYPESTAFPEGYFELVGFSAICGAPLSAASLMALILRRCAGMFLTPASAASLAVIVFATMREVLGGRPISLDRVTSFPLLHIAICLLGSSAIGLLIGVAVERIGRAAKRSSS